MLGLNLWEDPVLAVQNSDFLQHLSLGGLPETDAQKYTC